MKLNLSKSRIEDILTDPCLSDFVSFNLKDIGRGDLLEKLVRDFSERELECSYHEVFYAWTE